MKNAIPSKTDQIEALIHRGAYQLTLKYAGRDRSGSPQYSKVFTVTRKEIESYLRENYNLHNLPFAYSSDGPEDGLHIVPVPGGYLVYHQERGIRDPQYVVPSEDDAWNFYVDFMLRTSGTGLKY